MSTALIQVQEEIERSLYEKIRLELVALGYLPDITTFPNTRIGQKQFQDALDSIANTNGYAIELFSVGAIRARGLKKVPRMVIQKGRLLPGGIGGPPGLNYVMNEENQNFDGVKLPPQSTDYYLDIHLISNEERQDRVMNNVLGNAITTRSYIPLLSNPDQRFLILQIGYNETADMDEGIIERIYQYQIPDLYLTLPSVEGTASIITDITLEQENIPNTDINHQTTPNP